MKKKQTERPELTSSFALNILTLQKYYKDHLKALDLMSEG